MIFFRSNRFLSAILTVATIWLSWSIAMNSLIYFQSAKPTAFFAEKGSLVESPIWICAFYWHITASCICLLAGAPLMIPAMLRYRQLHRILGYLYFVLVLWIAAPTGLIMAPVAKGGLPGAVGFAVIGIGWWWTTWNGYQAIRKKEIKPHINWMIRSYSIALSAVTFRLFQIGLFYVGLEDTTNYILSIWLSLGTSVVMSELCIRNLNQKTKFELRSNIHKTVSIEGVSR